MSKYFVEDTSLTAVADAIREKSGTDDSLAFPDGFVSAVEGIQAGGVFELVDIPVDHVYTLSSDIVDAAVSTTLETYTLDSMDMDYDNYVGLVVATVEFLGEKDAISTCFFRRGLFTQYAVKLHGFALGTSPIYSTGVCLYENHGSGANDNITQVNFSGWGVAWSNARMVKDWNLMYQYHSSYAAVPGDYRIKIERYKIPLSFFGGASL